MLVIKIISPILLLVISLLQIALEYKKYWRDKRTKKHKIARILLITLLFVCATFTVATVIIDHKASNDLNLQLSDLGEKSKQQILEARNHENIAIEQRKLLEDKIVALNERLDPFVKIASSRFPDIQDEKAALDKLASELKMLESRTKRLEVDKEKERVRSTYQQPSVSLRNQVVSRLKSTAILHENLVIMIVCELGDQQRLRVVKDLIEMIKAAGIAVNLSTAQTFFREPPPPVRAVFNPDDEVLFHKVMSALEGYMGGEVTRTRKKEVQPGMVILKFYGSPVFFANTGVEFH